MAKSKVFSLDTYKKKSKASAAEYQIRVSEDLLVTLYNPLRIDADKRERLFEVAAELGESQKPEDGWNEVGDEDKELTMADVNEYAKAAREIILLVGDENVGILLEGIGNDLEVLFAIFQDYFEAVGLGEASRSED